MKKTILYFFLASTIAVGGVSCKAKHCVAYDDSMEGYKKPKRKKGRQEGLFDKKIRR
ncbi:hypothetical protein GYB22_09955 [bacterium]|nr:hypothetical protein [bacterium]